MREYRLPMAARLILFMVLNILLYETELQGQSKWSGTLTLTEKVVWDGGKSDRHVEVSFTNALPTLHRNDPTTDLNFTDDKGTGTAKLRSELIIGGKLIETTDCKGSGQTELHEVVIDSEDSSLTIHAIGPACNGQHVELLPGGKTSPYGPEFTDIIVSSKAMGGVNQTVLSGSYTTVSDIVGLGKATTTISWGLWRGPIDAVLIVSPVNYNNWMPFATSEELRKGNAMHINLKVQKRNGGDSPLRVSRFEIKLDSTSTEKGTTLNLPLDPSLNQLPDLRLLPDSIAESNEADQSIEINSTDGKTGYFSIGSYDGGGWTKLTAVAVLDGGIRIEGTLFTPTGVKEIPIPKRTANSKIATAWLAANGNPGEMDDKEMFPTKAGDGLTAYEEYRGVIARGRYQKLKPAEKELGIMTKRSPVDIFGEGIKWFESASGIKVIRFDSTDIGPDRALNKNFKTAHDYDQFAIFLFNEDLGGDAVGETQPENGQPKTPKTADKVVIDVNSIQQGYQDQANAARAGNLTMPYTYEEDIANTVAHELGHSVHINHHGKSSLVPSRKAYANSNPPFHIYWFDNSEETIRPYPVSPDGYLEPASETKNDGSPGQNDASGDLSCIMVYTSRYNWAFRKSNTDGSLYYYKLPLLAVGKRFCTSKTGTGINRPGYLGVNNVNRYFGNADPAPNFGNCLSQIQLRE